jgi:hypothetical protein
MPAAREHHEGDGLGYWSQFVDEHRLETMLATIEELENSSVVAARDARLAAQASLMANAGGFS